jgi:hypothetical protein
MLDGETLFAGDKDSRRPVMVWLISAWLVVGALLSAFNLYLLLFAATSELGARVAAIVKPTSLELVLMGLMVLANLATGILVFMKSRTALTIFIIAIFVNGIASAYQLFWKSGSDTPLGTNTLPFAFGWFIVAGILAYLIRARQTGLLK